MQLAMLAADFTPGEADSLRRAMAAWKRKGGLGPFHERLVGRMVEKGYDARVRRAHLQADPRLRRIRLPREPRRQLCAAGLRQLLAQAPPPRCLPRRAAQQPADGLLRAGAAGARRARAWRRGAAGRRARERLGEHARRRGRRRSRHAAARSARRAAARRCAWASTASAACREDAAQRIVAARAAGAVRQRRRPGAPRRARRARRCSCWRRPMRCTALTGHRHQAAWAVAGIDTRPTADAARHAHARGAGAARRAERGRGHAGRLPRARPHAEAPPAGAAARAARRVQGAAGGACCAAIRNGRLARASGLVTHRQRPETAKGTVFVTLEDETGAVNVIVWPRGGRGAAQAAAGRDAAHGVRPVAARGRGRGVMHLLAREADRPLARCCRGWSARSRDFR